LYDPETETASRCGCVAQKRLDRLVKSSRITPAFRSKTLENFTTADRPGEVRALHECAKDYADALGGGHGDWLCLLGEPGCGKTHLAIAIANCAMSNGIPAMYFPHVDGLAEIKSSLSRRGEGDAAQKIEELKRVDLLLWDDLFWGQGSPRPFELEVVFEVLNYRYLNLLCTVITSNHSPSGLLEIDATIGSRIIERSRGYLVYVSDPSANYRLR
jgi:DNA replication protein DnaC